MDTQRARHINSLFEEAAQLEGAERAAWLDECEPDSRHEVEELLAAYDDDGEFLTRSALEQLTTPPLEPGTRVGSYRIVRTIGAGGGGVVYEAEQQSPKRRVALKVRPTVLSSEAHIKKEAETLARLQHPDIAHVYEAGMHEELAYFAMELVKDACTLTEHARTLERRAVLELFARVCDAVHHGHERGIIHRDLKPQNILVLSSGFPKIIDFGIARVEGMGAGEGEFAGTPPYMSPEQCTPGEVDERSDVYSLGVVLYELLTNKLPQGITDTTLSEATRRIREEPPAPAQLPFELKAIVMKALAKEPAGRYDSAASLAQDIRRYLVRRPVAAVGGGLLYRGSKFLRRNRVASALLVASLALVAWNAFRSPDSPQPRVDPARVAEVRAYATQIGLVQEQLHTADHESARKYLERIDESLRGWEWRYLRGQLDVSKRKIKWHQIRVGAISRDGLRGAAIGSEASAFLVRIWDLDTGRVVQTIQLGKAWAYSLAFAPDARTLAVGFMDGPVEIRSVSTGEVVRRFDAHQENVTSMLFHPGGDWLATASKDRTVKLWSPGTGKLLRTLRGHEDRVICLALHGEKLATGGRDGVVITWDLGSNGPPTVANVFRGISVEGVAWRPDGAALVAAARDGQTCVWRVGEQPSGPRTLHTDVARSVAFSPDGGTFATASWDGSVLIWRGQTRTRLLGHTDKVMSVFYRGDDEVVSFAMDGTVRFWDLRRLDSIAGHTKSVHALAFSSDGRSFATASYDETIKVWDVETQTASSILSPATPHPWRLEFGPDDETLLCSGVDDFLAWNLRHGGASRHPIGPYFDRAGDRLYTATSGVLQVWTLDFTLVRSRAKTGREMRSLAAHPDGRRLVTGDAAGAIRMWRVRDLTMVRATEEREHSIRHVACSPDGKRIAAVWQDGTVRILDAETLTTLSEWAGPAQALAFSPDGSRLATGGHDWTVCLWDVETGEQVLSLSAGASVTTLAFSPDGNVLAAGCVPKTRRRSAPIRIWRVR